jgi:broad specificity phosphatase PhoE
MSTQPGRVVVVRHGETEWSRTHRHTGRTDVPLTTAGEERAARTGDRLAAAVPDLRPGLVLSSPLLRARRTAELAGFSPAYDDDLLEWDYGSYEGRTTEEIRDVLGDPDWSVWTTSTGLGESAAQVGERTAALLARVEPVLGGGEDAVLFAHAHVLRILTATWLGLPATRGQSFALAPAGIGVLGHEREAHVVSGWNL